MAQPQNNITLMSPGFQGLNTEDSPLSGDVSFCLQADNAIIDQFGRLGSREAFATYTTSFSIATSTHVNMATETFNVLEMGHGIITDVLHLLAIVKHEQFDSAGNSLQTDYYVCKDVSAVLTEVTLPTLSDDANLATTDFVYFNDAIYLCVKNEGLLKYDGTALTNVFSGTIDVDYIPPTDDTGVLASAIDGDVALSAYGRLWVAGVNGDYSTIYYSDLLLANQWYDGRATPADSQNTGGIIDVSEYWPNGGDRIVALAAHNNFLIIFGRQSILIYGNAQSGDPAGADGIFLSDSIKNMGALGREAVANIGSDVLFVDDSGVRSLGRTIQEKSVPIGDLTRNVRKDIVDLIRDEPNDDISLFYMPHKDMTVLLFADTEQAYVLDMKQPANNGNFKVTRWTQCKFRRGMYVEFEDTATGYLASTDDAGLLQYDGYIEYTGAAYDFIYASSILNFSDAVRQKFIKRIDYTVISTVIDTTATVRWGYGGQLNYTSTKTIVASPPALYNVAQFNVDVYGDGLSTTRRYKINTKGSGSYIRTGIDIPIDGNSASLQEINVQTLIGRIN